MQLQGVLLIERVEVKFNLKPGNTVATFSGEYAHPYKFFPVGGKFLVHLHCSPPFSMDRHLATTVSNCSKLSPVFADSWPFF